MPAKSRLVTFTILIILFTHAGGAEGRVIHVVKDATGTGDSWDNALGTITAGLTAAASGDDVWVKSATYTEAITLKTGVRLYGGFAGSETAEAQRNWRDHETAIDAKRQYHTVVHGADQSTLDGFTITNGYRGFYCHRSTLVIANCLIKDSSSNAGDGGIYCISSNLTLRNSIITGNSSLTGGISCFDSSATIEDCTITANSYFGLDLFSATAALANCTISGNKGTGLSCLASTATLIHCTISDNVATNTGGGIRCKRSSPILTDCTISNNTATRFGGGGVFCEENSSPVFVNCIISGNMAVSPGGGIRSAESSAPTFTNCTIVDNSSYNNDGGGVSTAYGATATLTNCIIWNRSQDIAVGSEVSVMYSSVRGGWLGEGNIDAPPLFVDAAHGDYRLREHSPCIDRGLVSAAPVTDIQGNLRPGSDGLVDMGAYESPDSYTPGPENHVPTTLFVRSEVQAGGDGSTWDTAFNTLTAALDIAAASDEVWVKAGRYNESTFLVPSVAVYGGFTGTETDRAGRDWVANETIIDATGSNRSAVTGANQTLLDGFVITGGNSEKGGGVYYPLVSVAGLANCTITGNAAADGGGVYCFNSSPSLTNCRISHNTARNYGGLVLTQSTSTVTRCSISDNSSDVGGGIYCSGGSPSFRYCTISGNSVRNPGTRRDDGGIVCRSASPKLENCTLSGNSSNGVYSSYSAPALTNCIITGNTGGVYFRYSSNPLLTNCTIAYNSETAYSSGVFSEDSSPILANCIIWNQGSEISTRIGDRSRVTVRYSCIQGGWPGEGNINAPPRFEDPANGDFRLQDQSPCIDRGDVSAAAAMDALGNPRPGGDGLVDMGAYESTDAYSPGPAQHEAARIFVRSDASPGGDGLGWSTAVNTITAGLYLSSTSDEIWVKGGRYRESISLERGVSLFGGFAGTETEQAQRNWVENETIIDATGLNASTVCGATESILDGFTLTGGYAKNGGGLLCQYKASPLVMNCRITGNKATYNGGGVYCDFSSPVLKKCLIADNTSESSGGGLGCYFSSSPTIVDSTIRGNISYAGGGILCRVSLLSLTGCMIINNAAAATGGGLYIDYSPEWTTKNCTISGNRAVFGGGVFFNSSSPVLVNCTILGNTATRQGGGAYLSLKFSEFANCTFSGNTSAEGGGIYNLHSTTKLTNCILWDNGPAGEINGISVLGQYSCIQGGYPGIGNISDDPRFVLPWNSSTGDFHLQPDSPCIDTGDPSIFDGCMPPGLGTDRSDMGAYGGPDNCGWIRSSAAATFTVH